MQCEHADSGKNQCKGNHLTVFVFIGCMIPFLSVFLFSEEVAAEVQAVVDGTEAKREAGKTEDTPNTPALVQAGLVLFNCTCSSNSQWVDWSSYLSC